MWNNLKTYPDSGFPAMNRRINVVVLGCIQVFLLDTFTDRIWYFFVFHTIRPTDLLYSSPAPHSSTFQYISDLFSEMSHFQHNTNLCSLCSTSLASSVNLSPICWWKKSSFLLLPWKIRMHISHHLISCYKNNWNISHFPFVCSITMSNEDGFLENHSTSVFSAFISIP